MNFQSDIPLLGALNNGAELPSNFVIHWLNNKEFYSTMEAEKILEEMSMKEEHESNNSDAGVGPASSANTPITNGGLPHILSDPAINGKKTLSCT